MTLKKALVSRRGQGGGPAPYADASVWEAWRDKLQGQQQQHWSSQELADVFETVSGRHYSASHLCGLLRHHQCMYYYKPRPLDYRRDDQAQEQLRSRIRARVDGLVAMAYDLQHVKWGYVDEVAVQLHTNNVRFWSFEPCLSRPVNANPGSQKYLGFYGLNDQSHLVALADGCADSLKLAMEEVKLQQTECSALVVILDNASSHKALETWGWERRIFFVWLPAYSPEWSATAVESDREGVEKCQT